MSKTKVFNAYSLLLKIENDLGFLQLVQKGIIPLTVLDKKVYYENFLNDYKKTGKFALSISNCAEEYRVSEMTIRRAIKFMEK